MNKHTPGPWTYFSNSGNECAALVAKGSFICEFIEAPSEDDAYLIAAAPELLEALKDCRRALEVSGYTGELAVVDAAIAKATGEQS